MPVNLERQQVVALLLSAIGAFRTTYYKSVEPCQHGLDEWLVHDNPKRPHLGYRSPDRRPIDTIHYLNDPSAVSLIAAVDALSEAVPVRHEP